ncbi:MAG TPA: response regulator [Pirellulales bacterium]|jgi:response regulator NasT
MTQGLRILVADDEADMRDYFNQVLPEMGHQVVGTATNGRQLVDKCRELHPDLVVTDIKMPDLDGIDAAGEIYNDRPVPVILVSAYHEPELFERAEQDHILAYLVKPIKRGDLEPAIAIATQRFAQFKALRIEANSLRQALEDRKIIERAKGILMLRANLSEPDAFRRLQKLARDQNRKLVDIATMIVTAEKALQPTESV